MERWQWRKEAVVVSCQLCGGDQPRSTRAWQICEDQTHEYVDYTLTGCFTWLLNQEKCLIRGMKAFKTGGFFALSNRRWQKTAHLEICWEEVWMCLPVRLVSSPSTSCQTLLQGCSATGYLVCEPQFRLTCMHIYPSAKRCSDHLLFHY